MDDFDLVVIGGGSGGYTAAIRATQLGLTAAIVERDKVGGTCLHKGCIPTKVLLETAETLSLVRKSNTFGVRADNIALDYAAVAARKRHVVDTLHKSLRSVIQKHKIEIIEGQASLLSPTQVSANGRTLNARHVVLATGSRPKELPGLPTDGVRVLNSDYLLELPEPPQSIVIVGAGAVGAEFASFYLDIGSQVSLVEMMPTILPLEDADVGKALAKALAARGANIMTSARVLPEGTRTYDNMVELTVQQEGQEKTIQGHAVLVAVGREAVTDGLGLENTGVKLDRGFIAVDERYRTEEPTVYAVGDAIGGLLLAHVAAAEGFLAAESIAGKEVQPLDYGRAPRVTYSRPQVAAVGLTEQEARKAGRNIKSQRFSFRYNAMALIQDEPEGFAKLVYDAGSGDLLGAHIIGHHASELISEASLARFLEASAWEVGSNIHPHPTLSEVLGEAAQLSAGISIYW
ncbi:MAG: dihydrolipoyl dehydrogenase [Chloroflexi bacterium]|nr:dihydrolipoyl dehydrogenase [Chloroflexota bacterium]